MLLALALVLVVAVAVLSIGVAFLIYGTLRKNQMGINVTQTSCPACGAPLPRVRKPANMRQALWGGWTCPSCGLELDKWGRASVKN